MRTFKIVLITTAVIGLILYGLWLVSDVRMLKTSDFLIEFAPARVDSKIETDSITDKPKNIIVFIADGMGFSQLSMAMLSQQESDKTSVWSKFPVKGWHDARCTDGPITDSGASATAMATGTQTYFEIIGRDKDQKDLKNIFEEAAEKNYATGVVTDSYVWDATPAGFTVHTEIRYNARDILNQLGNSQLDLLFGELFDIGDDYVPSWDSTEIILERRFQLLDESLELPKKGSDNPPVAAIFEEDQVMDLNSTPNLPQLADVALSYLSQKEKPFFLMVESEEIDLAGHENDSHRLIEGLRTTQKTLERLLAFAEQDGETLLLFTADHETGGLAADGDLQDYPNMFIAWTSNEHTASVVPILAIGPGAEYFRDVQRNWEIGVLLKSLLQ